MSISEGRAEVHRLARMPACRGPLVDEKACFWAKMFKKLRKTEISKTNELFVNNFIEEQAATE